MCSPGATSVVAHGVRRVNRAADAADRRSLVRTSRQTGYRLPVRCSATSGRNLPRRAHCAGCCDNVLLTSANLRQTNASPLPDSH